MTAMPIPLSGRVLLIFTASLCLQPMILGSQVQLAGHWEGTMVRDGASLEVSFDFSTSGSQPTGTFTSVTQQAMDYPLNVVTITDDGVHFALGDSIVFDGKLVSDHIVGTFTDDGVGGKFTLHRSLPEALPYDSFDVIFRNGARTRIKIGTNGSLYHRRTRICGRGIRRSVISTPSCSGDKCVRPCCWCMASVINLSLSMRVWRKSRLPLTLSTRPIRRSLCPTPNTT